MTYVCQCKICIAVNSTDSKLSLQTSGLKEIFSDLQINAWQGLWALQKDRGLLKVLQDLFPSLSWT